MDRDGRWEERKIGVDCIEHRYVKYGDYCEHPLRDTYVWIKDEL